MNPVVGCSVPSVGFLISFCHSGFAPSCLRSCLTCSVSSSLRKRTAQLECLRLLRLSRAISRLSSPSVIHRHLSGRLACCVLSSIRCCPCVRRYNCTPPPGYNPWPGSAETIVFMKGTPDAPRCGFSRTLVGLLREENIVFESFDILEDDGVRQGLKEVSNWPTYPQVRFHSHLCVLSSLLRTPPVGGLLKRISIQSRSGACLVREEAAALRVISMSDSSSLLHDHVGFQESARCFIVRASAVVRPGGACGRPGHYQGDEARGSPSSAAWRYTQGKILIVVAARLSCPPSWMNTLCVTAIGGYSTFCSMTNIQGMEKKSPCRGVLPTGLATSCPPLPLP